MGEVTAVLFLYGALCNCYVPVTTEPLDTGFGDQTLEFRVFTTPFRGQKKDLSMAEHCTNDRQPTFNKPKVGQSVNSKKNKIKRYHSNSSD